MKTPGLENLWIIQKCSPKIAIIAMIMMYCILDAFWQRTVPTSVVMGLEIILFYLYYGAMATRGPGVKKNKEKCQKCSELLNLQSCLVKMDFPAPLLENVPWKNLEMILSKSPNGSLCWICLLRLRGFTGLTALTRSTNTDVKPVDQVPRYYSLRLVSWSVKFQENRAKDFSDFLHECSLP